MAHHIKGHTGLKRREHAHPHKRLLRFTDFDSARRWLLSLSPDSMTMHRIRDIVCHAIHDIARLTDVEVLDLCAWQMVDGKLLLKHEGPGTPSGTKPTIKNYIPLKQACHEAFALGKDCSDSVARVLQAKVDPNYKQLDANGLIDYLGQQVRQENSPWQEVDMDKAWKLAQQDVVVVAGVPEKGKDKDGRPRHGHVVIIFPGNKKADLYNRGKYPLCMSRSKSTYIGTNSDGTLTVVDPFTRDDQKKIHFWAYYRDSWLEKWPVNPASY